MAEEEEEEEEEEAAAVKSGAGMSAVMMDEMYLQASAKMQATHLVQSV